MFRNKCGNDAAFRPLPRRPYAVASFLSHWRQFCADVVLTCTFITFHVADCFFYFYFQYVRFWLYISDRRCFIQFLFRSSTFEQKSCSVLSSIFCTLGLNFLVIYMIRWKRSHVSLVLQTLWSSWHLFCKCWFLSCLNKLRISPFNS